MEARTIDPPAARDPRPVADEYAVLGRRVQVAMIDDTGIVRHMPDYRAASEVYTDGGRQFVNVVAEADWYAWRDAQKRHVPGTPERCPGAIAAPAVSVWCE